MFVRRGPVIPYAERTTGDLVGGSIWGVFIATMIGYGMSDFSLSLINDVRKKSLLGLGPVDWLAVFMSSVVILLFVVYPLVQTAKQSVVLWKRIRSRQPSKIG